MVIENSMLTELGIVNKKHTPCIMTSLTLLVSYNVEQSARQCNLCSISVDLPSLSKNISVPGLVP